jgi:MFS family permease
MVASVPIGWFADRVSRVRIVWILSVAWSVGALAAAVADGFWQLFFACLLIGAAASSINPCAFSLLADYFSTEKRSLVISAFSAVIFIGYDAGLVTGVISEYLGWRYAFTFLGIPAFLVFFPALLMREPARGLSEQDFEDNFTIQVRFVNFSIS